MHAHILVQSSVWFSVLLLCWSVGRRDKISELSLYVIQTPEAHCDAGRVSNTICWMKVSKVALEEVTKGELIQHQHLVQQSQKGQQKQTQSHLYCQ